jgi:DNA-binding XRE family transcriptional regulator
MQNMPITDILCRNRSYNTIMTEMSFMSADELQGILGERLRYLRINKNLDQRAVAERAGISEKALRNLEGGRGSSVESLVRVLKALGSLEGIEMLAPKPSVNPIALLRSTRPRQRVRHPRVSQGQTS